MPSLVQVDFELNIQPKTALPPPPHPMENAFLDNEIHLNTIG